LNPAFNSPQVVSALSHLETAHLIIGAETSLPYKPPKENVTLLRQIVPDLTLPRIESASVPTLKNIILVDNSSARVDISPLIATTPFSSLLQDHLSQAGRVVTPDSPLHVDDIINIQFTSGTTSHPKAACLTHTGILNNGYFIGLRMGLTPEDVVCCPPPLFHCFGSILGYMATATHGSAILFPSEAFNPLATLLSIQEHQATALYGVATMFVAELELLANKTVPYTGFSHLRTGIAAGSSVPSHLMEKLHKTLNLTGLTICYGMTETSPVSCMTTPDDPLEKRVDSVGRLLPHVEAKIVDVHDRSRIMPLGERGELVVSGYNIMQGYWGDVARTEEVRVVESVPPSSSSSSGPKVWMHTGDEAEMDSEGYVKITGRIKDLIIRGGENIHPLEVENALFMLDEVSEASVVGLPDPRYGECVAAFLVVHAGVRVGVDDAGAGDPTVDADTEPLATGADENPQDTVRLTRARVREWVRGQLSNHLVPRYVFWVREYPKTASGKIQKFKLREMGMAMLEGREGEDKEVKR
jgi:acyl-CoA synthetase (AMP-forming)/AMP-acid ligase II